MSRTEANVQDWINQNVRGDLRDWIINYLDDPDIDDDELRDMRRWNIEGIEAHIVESLSDIESGAVSKFESLDDVDSLEEAFELKGPGGEWFYAQLIEFFHLTEQEAKDRRQAEHVSHGGASSLYDGEL